MLLPCQSPWESPELQGLRWGEIQAALKPAGIYRINSVGSVFWAWCLQSVRWVSTAKVMDWGPAFTSDHQNQALIKVPVKLKQNNLLSKHWVYPASLVAFVYQISEFCSILTLYASLDLCSVFWRCFLSCLCAHVDFLGGVVVGGEWRWICSVLTEGLPLSLQIHWLCMIL